MSFLLSGRRLSEDGARHPIPRRAMTDSRERLSRPPPSVLRPVGTRANSDCAVAEVCARPMPLERWCMRRRRKCRVRQESSAVSLTFPVEDAPPLFSYGCDPWRCGCEPCGDFSSPPCRLRSVECSSPAERREDSSDPSLVPLFLAVPFPGSRSSDVRLSSLGLGAVNLLTDYDVRGGDYAGGVRSYSGGADPARRCRKRRWTFGGALSRPFLCLVWLFLVAVVVGGAGASIMGDGCDWSGSGLEAEMEASRGGAGPDGGLGVRPVYLRCSQGAVSWAYPRGALRVLLRLSSGGANEEFRGCVRLGRTWKGARLFLEGVRSLHPLFPQVDSDSVEPSKGARVRCFQSRNGQAALYVEATPGGVSPRGRTVASFEYHLQPLPNGVKTFDPSEECRPCTMEEMTHAFCSSDLVTRGTIRSVESRDDPETSELRVRVTKLIRRTRAPPPPLEDDPYDEDDELQEEGGSSEEEDAGKKTSEGNGLRRGARRWWDGAQERERGVSVTLHVPTHCGVRHGAGEFVFMAQRKLGQLRLRCAPRLEDWAELARKSNRLAKSPCVLQA